MNTELITNLINENVKKSERIKEYDKLFNEYQDKLKIIFTKETEEAKKNSLIMKTFYSEELDNTKTIIQELSYTIDDILLK